MEPDNYTVGEPDTNIDPFDDLWGGSVLDDEDPDIVLEDDYSEDDYE